MEGLNMTAEQQYSYYYKNLVGRDADLISFGNYYIVTLDSIGLKDAISYKFDTLEEAISFIHNQRCCWSGVLRSAKYNVPKKIIENIFINWY